jgi:DNA polymerase-1
MKQITFDADTSSITTAILIKTDNMIKQQLEHFYVKPLAELGIDPKTLIAFDLLYTDGKVSAKEGKAYVLELLKMLDFMGVQHLIVADSTYFKFITGIQKTATARGYVHKCNIHPYKHMNVILSMNYGVIYHNANSITDLERSLVTYSGLVSANQVSTFTHKVLTEVYYPDNIISIYRHLQKLHLQPMLTCDIETFSLRFEKAGIGTIAFAWDLHSGVAFEVDCLRSMQKNYVIRSMLKNFFDTYQGKLIFHNALFDVKILTYQLYMEHDADWEGLEKGLETFSNIDDSMVIAFLATNSTADAPIGLKELAYDYVGDYAEDVKDIRLVDKSDLLEYNLTDCVATWYVYNKYYPIMVNDNQLDFYYSMALPTLRVSLKMMLVGLPMDMKQVAKTKDKLTFLNLKYATQIANNPYVAQARHKNNVARWNKANSKLKTKIRPLSDFNEPFNPNSDAQLSILLYDVLKLPILDTTDSGAPSTSAKVIKRLMEHEAAQPHLALLNSIIGISETSTVISTFINAFESYAFTRKAPTEFNDTVWLNGNLKSTGTISGRFSSGEPNLQNLPSNSAWGKPVKECFVAPEGYLFVYADFNALEAKINALLTKDPNKIKVFAEGYDSHSLNAYTYYGDQMEGIDPTDPESINSIADKYKALRARSKSPTFALQYGGSWKTLVKNLGFSREEAESIEARYHRLYEVSNTHAAYVNLQASRNGYTELAFGLRLRTPVLKSTVMNVKNLPALAAAEGRTINNAESQSYGMLLNRALIELDQRLRRDNLTSEILMANCIHDAAYFIVKKDPEVVYWLNQNLIEVMSWQEDPAIKSTEVLLGAELDIGTTWANGNTIPNDASIEYITEFLEKL